MIKVLGISKQQYDIAREFLDELKYMSDVLGLKYVTDEYEKAVGEVK